MIFSCRTNIPSLALNQDSLPICYVQSWSLLNDSGLCCGEIYSKITSYTRFAYDLKENSLHAIISDFTIGETPGVGTFYDIHNRLWLSNNKNVSNTIHPPKKNKNQGAKGRRLLPLKKQLSKIYSAGLRPHSF